MVAMVTNLLHSDYCKKTDSSVLAQLLFLMAACVRMFVCVCVCVCMFSVCVCLSQAKTVGETISFVHVITIRLSNSTIAVQQKLYFAIGYELYFVMFFIVDNSIPIILH